MQRMHELFDTVDVLFGPPYSSPELVLASNCTGRPGVTMRAGLIQSPSVDGSKGVMHTITRNVGFPRTTLRDG
jgi:hypothetical protein